MARPQRQPTRSEPDAQAGRASEQGPSHASTSIREDGAAVLIAVRARPRAHREGIGLESDGAWPVSVRALPSEGAANEAVVALVARALGRPLSTCSLRRGHRGRDKLVRAEAMSAEAARRKLQDFAR